MARCVVHDDKSPSVSIQQKGDRVSIKCFAGCDTRDILRALGLTFRDLGYKGNTDWARRVKTSAVRPSGKRKPLGELEATYRYTDERGELMAEKLRFAGKVFLWRRPNGAGWIWKVDRDTLPLFLLHEVANAQTVVLTEGEKDALNLRSILKPGMAVTTAPNGAKSWRSDYARWFAGKMVWILPDSDKPGSEYARRAARDIAATARSVRIVGMAPAKDVSDFLVRHTAKDLAARVRTEGTVWHGASRSAC